ncbi:MAG: IS630 family transposase, partial [Thermoguttaceae bacterium]|nr:IS630 family transposase [Thermoguttaceae bacterium]
VSMQYSSGVLRPEKDGHYAKKKTFAYAEKSEEKRAKFVKDVAQIPEEKRVYMDESGVDPCLIREHGRAPRGTKVEDVKRGQKFQRTNVIAAKIGRNMVASWCYSQNRTSHLFVEWFRKTLVQYIQKDTTVMMDSTSFHPHRKLRCLARKYNLRILFLPPYSPDLNPIEKVWANRKRALVDLLPHSQNLENAIMEYLHQENC